MSPIDIKVLSTTAMKTVFEELAPPSNGPPAIALPSRSARHCGSKSSLAKARRPTWRSCPFPAPATWSRAAGSSPAASSISPHRRSASRCKKARRGRTSHRSKASSARCWRQNRSPAQNRSAAARAAFISRKFSSNSASPRRCRRKRNTALGRRGLAGLVVLRGEADIGIQQLAELMAVDGIDLVGPLPSAIQMVTPFVAGIPTKRFMRKRAGQ